MLRRSYDYNLKICMLGNSGVGKTAILKRYSDDQFEENTLATIGVDFKFKSINIEDNFVKLQLWDTAGQERFRSVLSSYYRDADAIIFVYDSLNLESLRAISLYWLSEVKRHVREQCLLFIFANKCDQRSRMTREEREWCERERLRCFEVSALTGIRVHQSINQIVSILTKVKPRNKPDSIKMSLEEYSPLRVKSGCC